MKITNESPENIRTYPPNIGNDTTAYGHLAAQPSRDTNGFALDISGNVMDNTAYGGHGRTTEDVMQDAGQQDLSARRNYMAVMSNTMSEEDFARLQKEGVNPGDMDIETVVTIVDHIKAALIQGGTTVAGYTDDLEAQQFEEITGDKALALEMCRQFKARDLPATEENIAAAAKAWEKAEEITELSEGAVKYMVENKLPPTVEHLYLAQFSGAQDAGRQGRGYYAQETGSHSADFGKNYYAKKAENYNWAALQPQMEKVINEAGYEVNEETLNDSKWLIEKGIPFTPDNLIRLRELREISLPLTVVSAAKAITAALANAQNPLCADVRDPRSYLEKARAYQAEAAAMGPQAVDMVIAGKQKINLKNLAAAARYLNREAWQNEKHPGNEALPGRPDFRENTSPEALTAKRQLEEIRLKMTVEVNVRLLRSGFTIETASLEQLVGQLKEAEKAIQRQLTGAATAEEAAGRYTLYQETVTKVSEITGMPAALIGRMAMADPTAPATLNQVHESGALIRQTYEKAGEAYEAVMTAPRKDLGDSIRKAFRNVDDILTASGLEVNESNRRAVRILGYNRMELTADNIAAAGEKDRLLQDVIEKMKPGTVLAMIREKVNPLTMKLEELNRYLDAKNFDPSGITGPAGNEGASNEIASNETASNETAAASTAAASMEDYSHFLYKLEQKNGITAAERSVYIGVYRLLRQVEKGDSAVVGAMMNAEMEFSMGNLLTAIRSGRKQGREFVLDDNFGGLRAQSTGADLESNLKEIMGSLEAPEAEEAYINEQVKEVAQLKNTEDAVIRKLLNHHQPLTWNMLTAAGKMMRNPGMLFRKAGDYAKETGKEARLKEAVDHLYEHFTDAESADGAYRQLHETVTDIFQSAAADEEKGALDIRELGGMCRQISLAAAWAQDEQYEIPVEINGELTAINLRIIHGKKAAGAASGMSGDKGTASNATASALDTAKVAASAATGTMGRVTGEFTVDNGVVNGLIAGNEPSALANLKQSVPVFKQMLAEMLKGIDSGNAGGINSRAESGTGGRSEKGGGLTVGTVGFIQSSDAAEIHNIINATEINNTIYQNSSIYQNSLNYPDRINSLREGAAAQTPEKPIDAAKPVSDQELYLVAKAFIGYLQKVAG